MGDLKVKVFCSKCVGTGTFVSPEGSITCPACNGTGRAVSGGIDAAEILAKLDYIHGKVTAIWNQVKP